MSKQLIAAICLAIFLVLAGLASRSWRKRAAAQESEFSAPFEALEFFGELLTQVKAFYVSTTLDSNHLERIKAYGLGSRGIAQVLVFTEGLLIVRNGERPLAIDRAQLVAISTTQVAIDKVVEPQGLLSVSWIQDGVLLATQLRIVTSDDRARIITALREITSSKSDREVVK